MFKPWDGARTGAGMAWDIGRTSIGHAGSIATFSARLSLLPAERAGIVVLANVNSGPFLPGTAVLMNGVTGIVRGRRTPPWRRMREPVWWCSATRTACSLRCGATSVTQRVRPRSAAAGTETSAASLGRTVCCLDQQLFAHRDRHAIDRLDLNSSSGRARIVDAAGIFEQVHRSRGPSVETIAFAWHTDGSVPRITTRS